LARGENADAVILEGGSADELGKKGFVRTDSKVVSRWCKLAWWCAPARLSPTLEA
jgi:hypothetical protein